MAEGHDETNPFDPNEGADERTPLIPEGMEMTDRTSTPFSSTSKHRTQETSFMGETPSGTMQMREESQNQSAQITKNIFPNSDMRKLFTRISEFGMVEAKLMRQGGKWYRIIDGYGNIIIDEKKGKFPKALSDALGMSRTELVKEKIKDDIAKNNEENERAEARVKELDEQIANAVGEEQKRLVEEREREQEGINERNQENEAIEERLSLRERIKEIFKKYGFTAIAVATAIATVIGVIVSNLKASLTKVAKGVGNGLKELGKKLGEILPGMIGAISSFIFRTAGEVIGFLAKNAWLLIVGLVLFAVEQFKNKKK